MSRNDSSRRDLLSVVLPLYREGNHFAESFKVIQQCAVAASSRWSMKCEFVLVDDGSSDDTWAVIESITQEHPHIVGIRFSRNFGKEAAVAAGLSYAQGDAVIVMDADLQHSPDLIPKMLELWREGYHVVNAVKATRGKESYVYRFAAATFNALISRLSGLDLAGASDFKLLDRRVVNAYMELRETQTFYRGLIAWLGFRCTSIPMTVLPRQGGRSGWTFVRLARLAITGLTSFSTLFLHGITLMGILFSIGAVLFGAYTFRVWLAGKAVAGFSTVILLQMIIGSVIMTALGIIGEYLSTIYHEVKGRPRYVVQARAGSTHTCFEESSKDLKR